MPYICPLSFEPLHALPFIAFHKVRDIEGQDFRGESPLENFFRQF
jgi:hypothetical protein